MLKELLSSTSSASEILKQLTEEVFSKSYFVSETEFELLQDKIKRNNPQLQIKTSGSSTYGFQKGATEAIFRFDHEELQMYSDYSLRELQRLKI